MSELSDLSVAIERFIATINNSDADGFGDIFTDDAVLDDLGRVFRGHAGIAAWSRTENIGVRSHFETCRCP